MPSLKRQYAANPGSVPVNSDSIVACTWLCVRTTFHNRTSSSPPLNGWKPAISQPNSSGAVQFSIATYAALFWRVNGTATPSM